MTRWKARVVFRRSQVVIEINEDIETTSSKTGIAEYRRYKCI